jgi:peptidoglycan/LPS O-acetylase OafA/YrhL
MGENRAWFKYLRGAAIALLAGWALARGQFSSDSRVQLCFAIALCGGILAANFPWNKLQNGTEHERNRAWRVLFAVIFGLLVVAGIGVEILVRQHGNWLVTYAPLALILTGLALLLERYLISRSSGPRQGDS